MKWNIDYTEDEDGLFHAQAKTATVKRKDVDKPWTTSAQGRTLDEVKTRIRAAIDEMQAKTIPAFKAPAEKVLHTSNDTYTKA